MKKAKCIVWVGLAFLILGCGGSPEIRGKITDRGGMPIINATVKIEGTQFEAQTDDSGSYSISFIPGRFSMAVSSAEYLGKKISYDIAQPTLVPAETIMLISKPNRKIWEEFLSKEIMKPFKSDFGVFEISSFAMLRSLAVTGFEQSSESEVVGHVLAEYVAKKEFPTLDAISQWMKYFSNAPRKKREGWRQKFDIYLKFAEPNSWTWYETSRGVGEPIDLSTDNSMGVYIRAEKCLENQKKIEKLISQWEKANFELDPGADRFADFSLEGFLFFKESNAKIDLNKIAHDKELFVCPEAKRLFGDNYNKPCYRFYNTDNTGNWIRGSNKRMGGKGVVCIFEIEGKKIGKIGENGPDRTKESAHYF